MDLNRKKAEVAYIGVYSIRVDKPLYLQLKTKVAGLGFVGALRFIFENLGPKSRNITFKDLTPEENATLEKVLNKEYCITSKICANRKARNVSENYSQEISVGNQVDALLFGSRLKAEEILDKKRQTKLNCNVGIRHKRNLKVRGQRTRSTGRVNKILKGFQRDKKKKIEKTEKVVNIVKKGKTSKGAK